MLTGDNQTLTAMAALLMWPIVCLCIFASSKSLSRSLIWAMLGAQLLLPVAATIKIQMVPQIDKGSIASFSALLGCLFFGRRKLDGATTRFGLVEILMILAVVSPIITSELNPDNLVIGGRFIPGVSLYDAISAAQAAVIALIPFWLGRRFLRTADDCRNILIILAIAGLGYSIPLLFEIRFSPQLHNWIYGYYPSDFVQALREGGFRPMVLMGHGLLAAFFDDECLGCRHPLAHPGAGWPSTSLDRDPRSGSCSLLCKSLGALVYAIFGFLLVFFGKPKTQFRVAIVLVTISMAYPLLRSFDLVPTKLIVELAASIDDERAESLAFRLDNEDMLLRRAFERPLFGWGRFGRNRVYDAYLGEDISVTDGRWVIVIGQFGLLGFLAEFGLLSICVLRAASAYRFQSAKDQFIFATLGLIVAINIFDLLPNSGLTPWTWLLSGALLGQAETLVSARKASRARTTTANGVIVSTAPRQPTSA